MGGLTARAETLIGREALLRDIGIELDEWAKGRTIYEVILNAPSVDAVQVVRCEHCAFSVLLRDSPLRRESPWCYYRPECRICRCHDLIEDEPIIVDDDFFCKHGVKASAKASEVSGGEQ